MERSEKHRARTESYNCLSAALLQIAKQGISLTYRPATGKDYEALKTCPEGKRLGKETLESVIWEGRNQSMHYETPNPFLRVVDCFANLEADLGTQFCLTKPPCTNRALFVVDLLGWKTYDLYLADMRLLLPSNKLRSGGEDHRQCVWD